MEFSYSNLRVLMLLKNLMNVFKTKLCKFRILLFFLLSNSSYLILQVAFLTIFMNVVLSKLCSALLLLTLFWNMLAFSFFIIVVYRIIRGYISKGHNS